MKSWTLTYENEVKRDLARLDSSVKVRVLRALAKVAKNPLPQSEGGYGVPLRNMDGIDLSGLLKIKLKSCGIRIVYKLEYSKDTMRVIVIGVREDKKVYREAARRREKYDL